jgi:hypothetical protein
MRPLQHQTWETFSVNWHADVRIAFLWLREALLKPLRPGRSRGRHQRRRDSRFAAQRRVRQRQGYPAPNYARDESQRAGLGFTFTTVLPRLTPLTELGRPAVQAYAARNGQSEEEYVLTFTFSREQAEWF